MYNIIYNEFVNEYVYEREKYMYNIICHGVEVK